MKTPRLRAVLRRLLFLGIPLVGACQCPEPVDRTVWWRGTRAEVQTLVDQCRTTGLDCDALCEKIATMREGYAPSIATCELVVDDVGTPGVHYTTQVECVGGRRPDGLVSPRGDVRRDAVGAWLAKLAHLEAASIHAFDALSRELDGHGARALARAARAAVIDEAHHAFLVGALARARGEEPEAPSVIAPPERSIEELARENAVEGCVRETYGALVAMRQAAHAADPAVRAAFATIAEDETRHAALAWAIDRWARERLSVAARRRIDDARATASDELLAEADAEVPAELTFLAGVPSRQEALSLASATSRALWS